MTRHHVISDLHLGMGKLVDGNWHPLEDFRSDAAFKKFLDFLTEDRSDELIINGDWIEFLQLEPFAYAPSLFSEKGHRLGWTEADSLAKLESCRAERAHKGLFDDLRSFLANNKEFKLTIMMGNHDPDLFWPAVQTEMRKLLGSPPEHQLQFCQTFTRRGTAHIEHGNQHCSPENKFNDPTAVFHACTADGKPRIEMVWGSIFVMEFFNTIEQNFPFADNLKTQGRAIWLGIKNGWVSGDLAAKFVKFIWGAGIPWGAIAATVLSEQPRAPDQLIQNIHDQALAQELLNIYDSNPDFRKDFDEEITRTPAEEWKAINSIDHQQPVTLEQLTPEVEGASPTLGIFRDEPEFRGAGKLLEQQGVEHVIFGHTHAEIDGSRLEAKVKNYFNTGTWVGSIDLAKKENRERLSKITGNDLKDETLFDLRLMAAVIQVRDDGQTEVTLQRLNI
jgi:UDP-2,3-diacylglucosamine pyrophosphatase LpxH